MHVGCFALIQASIAESSLQTHDGRGPFFLALKESSFGSVNGARLTNASAKAKTASHPANEIENVVGTQDSSSPVGETDITASELRGTGRGGNDSGNDSGHEPTLMNEYLASLRNELQSRIVYPAEAKSLRLSGRVEIEFNVDRRGYLTEISLAQSCEHAVLNRAALHLAHLLGQVRPPPEEIARDSVRVVVPLQYSIQR
jgi:TonB family protein